MLSGGYESLDLMVLAVESHVPPFIFAYISFNGRLDVDRLIDAVGAVAGIVPETLYRLDSHRPRFKKAGFTARDAVTESRQAPECARTWDLRHDTQVKIEVVHGPDDDSMILGISHVLSDGAGMMQYVALLADAYNGHLPHYRNNRSSGLVLAAADFGPATDREIRGRQIPPRNLPLPDGGRDHFCRHVTLPASTMKPLYDVAKSHSATLNDVFLTACGRVVCQMLDIPAVSLQCPVNLRPFIDAGPVSIANMSGLYRVVMDVAPGDPFSATLEQVHQEIVLQRERRRHFYNMPSLAKSARRFPAGILRRLIGHSYSVRPVEYTNLGVLPPLTFAGVDATSAFITGAYGHYPEFPVSISGFAGTTTFATTLTGDVRRADAGEEVVRRIIGEFENWLAQEGHPVAS